MSCKESRKNRPSRVVYLGPGGADEHQCAEVRKRANEAKSARMATRPSAEPDWDDDDTSPARAAMTSATPLNETRAGSCPDSGVWTSEAEAGASAARSRRRAVAWPRRSRGPCSSLQSSACEVRNMGSMADRSVAAPCAVPPNRHPLAMLCNHAQTSWAAVAIRLNRAFRARRVARSAWRASSSVTLRNEIESPGRSWPRRSRSAEITWARCG
jgi:hypothetical protein